MKPSRKQGGEAARGTTQPSQAPVEQRSAPPAQLEPDAIYQDGELVARVLNAEVDLDARVIRFGEIYQSDRLLLPDECEYQKYTVIIQRIASATKAEPTAMEKGRVLKGVIAEILGYREQ